MSDVVYKYTFYYKDPLGSGHTVDIYAENLQKAKEWFWIDKHKDLWRIIMTERSEVYCHPNQYANQTGDESPSASSDSLDDHLTNEVMPSGCDDEPSGKLNSFGCRSAVRTANTRSDRLRRFFARCSGRYD